MKKFLLSIILVFSLTFALCIVANAATVVKSGSCGDNLTYTLDSDGVLTISGSGAMTDYNPSSTYPVYSPWYLHKDSIKTIIVEDEVISIGEFAFYNCINLTDVFFREKVTLRK